jgi:hypothetical protein
MSTIQEITNAISYLQCKIPEELYRIKQDLEELSVYDDIESIKSHPFVESIIRENKRLRKKNRKLEKKLLRLFTENHSLLSSKPSHRIIDDSDSEDEVVQIHPEKKENIVYEIVEDEVPIKVEPQIKNETKKLTIIVPTVDFQEEEDVPVEVEEYEEVEVEEEDVPVEVEEEEEVEEEVEEYEEEEVEEEVEEYEEVEEEVDEEEEEEVEEYEEVEEEEEEVEEYEEVEEEEETGVVQGAVAPVKEKTGVVQGAVAPVKEKTGVVQGAVAPVKEKTGVVQGAVAPVEEEEDAVYEVTIKGKTYYVTNEVDSVIYDVDENGDVSIEAGIYKNGKPILHKSK